MAAQAMGVASGGRLCSSRWSPASSGLVGVRPNGGWGRWWVVVGAAVKEQLEHVLAFLNHHENLLGDRGRWPVARAEQLVAQLASQEPHATFACVESGALDAASKQVLIKCINKLQGQITPIIRPHHRHNSVGRDSPAEWPVEAEVEAEEEIGEAMAEIEIKANPPNDIEENTKRNDDHRTRRQAAEEMAAEATMAEDPPPTHPTTPTEVDDAEDDGHPKRRTKSS